MLMLSYELTIKKLHQKNQKALLSAYKTKYFFINMQHIYYWCNFIWY